MTNKFPNKIISLFSGAGGMDIGFRDAGFDISVAVEMDPSCCQTLKANCPNLKVIEGDLTQISTHEILNHAKLKPLEPALVIGGPPCQSFSLAGKRMGMNDKRGQLILEFVRVVKDSLPIAFVMENVKGMANWSKGKAIDAIKKEFEEPISHNNQKYQYSVKHQVINGAMYGLSQQRERLFIVGNRLNKDFSFPKATHGNKNETNQINIFKDKIEPYNTVWDSIGDLPPADPPSETAARVSQTIKGRIEKHGY